MVRGRGKEFLLLSFFFQSGFDGRAGFNISILLTSPQLELGFWVLISVAVLETGRNTQYSCGCIARSEHSIIIIFFQLTMNNILLRKIIAKKRKRKPASLHSKLKAKWIATMD